MKNPMLVPVAILAVLYVVVALLSFGQWCLNTYRFIKEKFQ